MGGPWRAGGGRRRGPWRWAQTQRQTAVGPSCFSAGPVDGLSYLDQTDRHTHPLTPNIPSKTPPRTPCLYFLPNGYSFGLCRLTLVPSNPTTSPCQSQRTVMSDPGPPWPSRNTLPLLSESLLSWFLPSSQSHLPNLLCRPLFPLHVLLMLMVLA